MLEYPALPHQLVHLPAKREMVLRQVRNISRVFPSRCHGADSPCCGTRRSDRNAPQVLIRISSSLSPAGFFVQAKARVCPTAPTVDAAALQTAANDATASPQLQEWAFYRNRYRLPCPAPSHAAEALPMQQLRGPRTGRVLREFYTDPDTKAKF